MAEIKDCKTDASIQASNAQEGLARIKLLSHEVDTVRAQLDAKRQKKRAHKATAQKYRELWTTARLLTNAHQRFF